MATPEAMLRQDFNELIMCFMQHVVTHDLDKHPGRISAGREIWDTILSRLWKGVKKGGLR